MSDVFISYRRDDGGSAGRLADNLANEIDVFFDTEKIDYGDSFPTRLEEELQSCRVFLAVIGPGWTSATNLPRLSTPNDWVRQELETGLSRGIRVVPIMLDKAMMPAADALPPTLQRLPTLDFFPLTHDSFKSQVKDLTARLKQWLDGPGGGTAPMTPAYLPFLCNRTAQEDNLVDIFSGDPGFRSAPFLIVHGHKWEEHDGFLERLRTQRSLGEMLGVSADVGVQVTTLQWSAQSAAGGKVAKSLLSAIKRNVLGKVMAPDADIRPYFVALRQPLVLTLQVTSDDVITLGVSVFEELAMAWRSLVVVDGAPALPYPVTLWVNLGYEDTAPRIALSEALGPARPFAGLLDELQPVGVADAKMWLKLPQVEPHVRLHEGAVADLFDDAQRCVAGTRTMHMRRFVEGVRAILSGKG